MNERERELELEIIRLKDIIFRLESRIRLYENSEMAQYKPDIYRKPGY